MIFEDRGPKCTLLVFIDDATSRLMHLQFVQTESTFAYYKATRTYLETFGKPIAFYSDKHTVFRINKPGAANTDGLTQFGRALSDLNIEIICANSSQAKGRVERANRSLQDRLAKELRLVGISSLVDGNAFLPGFIADYNARFAKLPAKGHAQTHDRSRQPRRHIHLACGAHATLHANQLRLWFASMAYVLLCAFRRIGLANTRFAQAICATLRLKLLKIGALVTISVRRVRVAMASAYPWKQEWALAHMRLSRLA